MNMYIQSRIRKYVTGGADLPPPTLDRGIVLSIVLCPFDAKDFQALPEHLKKSTFKKDQQMLSAQMLAGIPEVRPSLTNVTIAQVDLGIEVKIQNIERTERAKRDLLAKGEISTGELPR